LTNHTHNLYFNKRVPSLESTHHNFYKSNTQPKPFTHKYYCKNVQTYTQPCTHLLTDLQYLTTFTRFYKPNAYAICLYHIFHNKSYTQLYTTWHSSKHNSTQIHKDFAFPACAKTLHSFQHCTHKCTHVYIMKICYCLQNRHTIMQ
jgi:hypothetical protein